MIRKAALDDIQRLAEIHTFCWRYTYHEIIPHEILFKDRLVCKAAEIQKKILDKPDTHFDLYDDGIIKGFVIHSDSRDEDRPEAYELNAIYIEPLFQHQGIGSRLINHVQDAARDAGKDQMIVWVLQDNPDARRFYERQGFKKDGKSKVLEKLKARELRYSKEI